MWNVKTILLEIPPSHELYFFWITLTNELINVIRKKYNSCDGGISNIIII